MAFDFSLCSFVGDQPTHPLVVTVFKMLGDRSPCPFWRLLGLHERLFCPLDCHNLDNDNDGDKMKQIQIIRTAILRSACTAQLRVRIIIHYLLFVLHQKSIWTHCKTTICVSAYVRVCDASSGAIFPVIISIFYIDKPVVYETKVPNQQ